jgi:hypothetical protein
MTRTAGTLIFLTGFLFAAALVPQPLWAQGCDADEAMVVDYMKDISTLVVTTRKESLEEFQKEYHQKTCLTKLTLALSLVKELETCLDNKAHDPAATREQSDTAKGKQKKFAKLQATIEKDQQDLKGAESPKAAKAVIGKFDFSQ